MSDYSITISYIKDTCPFDSKRRSKAYCKICKAYGDPCEGLGGKALVVDKKIGKDKYMKILNIIK